MHDSDPFRALIPPTTELRRVGPIFDPETYLRTGRHSFQNLQKFAYLKPKHSVLDVGCGFGRVAIHLAHFLDSSARYLGVDVVEDEVKWCNEHITAAYPNFLFRHVDARNMMYNPTGSRLARDSLLPINDEDKFDIAILFSVFTHMLPADVKACLVDIAKHLNRGGVLFASFFLINSETVASMQNGRAEFSFVEQPGGYFAHNQQLHEAAVAYKETEVWDMLLNAGFYRDKIVFGSWRGRSLAESGQDLVVCQKL